MARNGINDVTVGRKKENDSCLQVIQLFIWNIFKNLQKSYSNL